MGPQWFWVSLQPPVGQLPQAGWRWGTRVTWGSDHHADGGLGFCIPDKFPGRADAAVPRPHVKREATREAGGTAISKERQAHLGLPGPWTQPHPTQSRLPTSGG